MKKLFFLAAAMLVSASMFAETETVTKSKDSWTGTSITINHNECANGSSGSYVKFRTNQNENTLTLNVNAGIKVTGVSLQAYSNNSAATISLSGVKVDGVAVSPFTPLVFPVSGDKENAPTYALNSLSSTQSIVFAFDNSNIDAGDDTKKNSQIMGILTITYEITAATYTATYKANNGTDDADVVDNKAMKVAANTFKKENAYFIGWNTAADGTGTPYEVGASLTADVTLFAQWKDFVAEKTMKIGYSATAPAVGDLVVLEAGSTGGYMAIFSAKKSSSFKYEEGKGLGFNEGTADVVKVVLDNYLKAGSIICINLISRSDDGGGLNLLDKDGNAKFSATALKDVNGKFYYEVKAGDGLEGTAEFRLQRAGSCYLVSVALGGLGTATAIDNTAAEMKTVKTFENGQLVIIKNGVKYNATGAIVK